MKIKIILSNLILLISSFAFSQTIITGTVIDNELNASFPGVTIVNKETNEGTFSDIDGKFSLTTKSDSGEVTIVYLGYITRTIPYKSGVEKTVDVQKIVLKPDVTSLMEVVVIGEGIIDLAKDRKTPIASSTIKAAEIQAKTGSSDITQAMVNSPSVYVAGQAGGYGDSRMSVRGFAQDNTAFLLNGQPINGMEDGKMYWSNWSGMADIANGIQIQRGLGSSKLAISSVGGTVNFITKATESSQGGYASIGVANNEYLKSTIAYNTGLSKNGWGLSMVLTHWQGNGYNQGTKGAGQNYFISVGYKPNSRHIFNFLLTGAPQWHDQNFTKAISSYQKYGRTYNDNWGMLNGEYISERKNFFHKPVANLNWDFVINDKTKWSTVVYASWGRGGGTGGYGFRQVTDNGQVDFDKMYANNIAANGEGKFGNKTYLIRASMNNHAWYGAVSNLKRELSPNLSLNIGFDIRTYSGTHYRQVSNFVGLTSWTESRKLRDDSHLTVTAPVFNTVNEYIDPNPWTSMFNIVGENQRIDYDYSEKISYEGLFGQLEYSKKKISAFVQGAVSNQSHQRFDRYDYLPEYKNSAKANNIGYNVKGGGSFAINEKNIFYINSGYYSRQPYHDNIYLNFTNQFNPLTKNEKILGFEAGYSLKLKYFSANINAYRTSWKDRVTTTSNVVSGVMQYKTNEGVEQVHTGIELDFKVSPIDKIDILGFFSGGDWLYKGDVVTTLRDENLNVIDKVAQDVDGGKVGDAAQLTYGLGIKYKVFERFSIDADWRSYDELYANVGAVKNNLKLPSYNLVDAGISYKLLVWKKKNQSFQFRVNVNNIFDEIYFSELTTNIKTTDNISATNPSLGTYESTGRVYNGLADANQGFFGFGRTWNATVRYNF